MPLYALVDAYKQFKPVKGVFSSPIQNKLLKQLVKKFCLLK